MHNDAPDQRHHFPMVTLLVTMAATGVSVLVARREWPTDRDGAYLPLPSVARDRLVAIFEFPVACFGVGLLLAAPGMLNHGETLLVPALAATSLGGLLVLQVMHASRRTA